MGKFIESTSSAIRFYICQSQLQNFNSTEQAFKVQTQFEWNKGEAGISLVQVPVIIMFCS